jgi:hypothetical protein
VRGCGTTASCGEAEQIDAEERGGFAEERGGFAEDADAEQSTRGARRLRGQPQTAFLCADGEEDYAGAGISTRKAVFASSGVLRALRVSRMLLS